MTEEKQNLPKQQETGKRIFKYRGKTIEDLKQMNIREFSKITNSKERRNILRNFQDIENFVNRCKKKIAKNKKIKTHKRDLVIVPEIVGMNIQIYNGRLFTPTEITAEMLGHRLGEFAPSRPKVNHGKAGIGATKGSKNKAKK